jgi:hypothetical protein
LTAAELHRRLTLPDVYRVLGIRMATFTVGHARLLDRLELAEIGDGSQALLFALLCRFKTAAEADKWLCSRFLSWSLVVWTNRKRRLLANPIEVTAAVEAIRDYLDASTQVPAYYSKHKGGDGETVGSPFSQHLRTILISKLGYSPQSVDDTPFLQAMWDYLSYMEAEGNISISEGVTDDELKRMEAQGAELLERAKKGEFSC